MIQEKGFTVQISKLYTNSVTFPRQFLMFIFIVFLFEVLLKVLKLNTREKNKSKTMLFIWVENKKKSWHTTFFRNTIAFMDDGTWDSKHSLTVAYHEEPLASAP